MGLNLRKRIGVMVLSPRLFLVLVTFAISLMGIAGKELLLVLPNGAAIVRSARGKRNEKISQT